ncbi:alpha/beta hydrolase family protein [Ferruginibacter profundus]
MNRLFLLVLIAFASPSFAQPTAPGIFRITSSYTSFPDTGRANGHTYDNVLYTAAEHYNDSSVLIIVPPKLNTKAPLDIIVWFHGWRNNIDSVPVQFAIIKQFIASNRNAILILPETTKDAPDSYGGKLEQKNVFKLLLNDVLKKLKTEKLIAKKTEVGDVVLAGHSGAFRVMAHILQNGAVEVKQTILFDALYSQTDKFINWIKADTAHQFINIYTDNGGTNAVSAAMMKELDEKNIPFIHAEEKDVDATVLTTNHIIFIHSKKEHNDVISRPDYNFQLYIQNSHVLKSIF